MKKSVPNSTRLSIVTQTTEGSVASSRKARRQAHKAVAEDTTAQAMDSIDMSKLEAAVQDSPTINTSKIVDIHSRIIAGEYKIDVRRLAEKVIELESILDFR